MSAGFGYLINELVESSAVLSFTTPSRVNLLGSAFIHQPYLKRLKNRSARVRAPSCSSNRGRLLIFAHAHPSYIQRQPFFFFFFCNIGFSPALKTIHYVPEVFTRFQLKKGETHFDVLLPIKKKHLVKIVLSKFFYHFPKSYRFFLGIFLGTYG